MAVRLVRRRDGRALALAEAESLDVDRDIDGETGPVRPVVDRAGGDVGCDFTFYRFMIALMALPTFSTAASMSRSPRWA